MMRSENFVVEKNLESLKPLDTERSIKDYKLGEHISSKEESFIKNLFSLFLERVCIYESVPLGVLMNTVERSIIIRVLSKTNGSQKEAAKLLGMKYTTFNEKVKKYKIQLRKKFY